MLNKSSSSQSYQPLEMQQCNINLCGIYAEAVVYTDSWTLVTTAYSDTFVKRAEKLRR